MRHVKLSALFAAALVLTAQPLAAACSPDPDWPRRVFCTVCSTGPNPECCTSLFYDGEFVMSYCGGAT